jgi:4-aminobutyrate aminotransferase-like enzyme
MGQPDPVTATKAIDGLRERGVLIGAAGQFGNVLKLRPPLCLTREQADLFLDTLDATLTDLEK